MNPLLLFILQTSIAGSITVVFYLLLHPLRQKILSAGWQYNLVKMLAFFFILPIGLLNTLPGLWQSGNPAATPGPAVPAAIVGKPDTNPDKNTIVAAFPEYVLKPMVEPLVSAMPDAAGKSTVGDLLFKIWLTGAALFVLYQILSFWQFYNKVVRYTYIKGIYTSRASKLCDSIALQMGLRKKLNVAINAKIHSPMVFFGRSNTVVLPSLPIGDGDLKFVICHELTHIKRHDLRNKFFFLCIRAIHWFNPLCHILARQLNIWCELSCDEAVVKNFSYEEKKGYGLSIINLMYTNKISENALCSSYACNKKNLKRRLNMLVKKQRFLKTKIALSIACTVFIGVIGWSSGVLASAMGSEAPVAVVNVASVVSEDGQVTVLEASEITGVATLIQLDNKRYKLDEKMAMLVSEDLGQTWQDFSSNYDTMKYLYHNLGVAFVTVEGYIANVEQMKNTPPLLPNINPDTVANWQANIDRYNAIVPELLNDQPISHVSLLFDFVQFEYEMPGDTEFSHTYFGRTLDDLYVSWKEQLDFYVELEMLTQEEANGLWHEFLNEFDLAG